jgi:hypothetical protein
MQHFDAMIAFIAVMLAASLVITAGTQLVISFLGLRGASLRRSLADLFETASQDRDAKRYAKEISRRVLCHPPISNSILSRFCVRAEDLPFVPAEAAGKLRWAASEIPFQPWLLGALIGSFLWPISLAMIKYLIFEDFCTYSAVITRYVPILSLCEHPWRSGAILGAVIGGLLGRWRLSTYIRIEELIPALDRLSAPPGGTLPDPAQRAMLVMAGETQSRPRSKVNVASTQNDKFVDDVPDDDGDGGVAVAVEKKVAQISGDTKPRLEGLHSYFDYAMERASQRFTVQVRVVTVVLSVALVFAAHLDAIRLFQTLSSDAQLRAQLGASADAIIKQAEQFSRTREGAGSQTSREAARSIVPEVYRKALVVVLQPTPAAEQSKLKVRHASHSGAAPLSGSPDPQPVSGPAVVNIQDSPSGLQVVGEADQAAPAVVLTTTEAPAKKQRAKSAPPAKSKAPLAEGEKSGAAASPGEDKAAVETRVRAAKALGTMPGFPSREDAVSWLHATLDGDPGVENVVAAYQQEVNAELVSDADKLIDHSASLQRELARSRVQLFPETWPGLKPAEHELPGLLVAVAFLSLCAPLCYSVLKEIANLRPRPATKRE